MGFFFNRKKVEQRVAANDFLPQHFGMFGAAGYNDSGVTINESNALIVGTVWACTSLIAQTVATLPVHVLNRKGGEKQYDHPLYQLLAVQPNEFMTPAVFREALMMNALIYGGAWAAIERDQTGYPVGLYPLKSSDVKPIRQAGQLLFEVRINSRLFTLTQYEVVNLLGWTLDGVTPLSPVRSAAQSLGLSVAMERYAAKAFSNSNVGGILQVPNLSTEAMKTFVASWRSNYAGIDNSFKTAVLPDPMKFTQTSMDPEKGQMNESRQSIIPTICAIWKVPPSMLGVLEKSSYASLEQQNMAFHQQTILPWLVKLEQAFGMVGFLERERGELELKFNADALLRTTTAERYSAYQQGRQGGWLSINDVRAKENLPPVEGGDTYLAPLNMAPVNGPTDPTKPTTEPALTPTPAATDKPTTEPVATDEPADAGVTTSLTLNGAQISSAMDVIDRLAKKLLVPFAATELLTAVGISRDAAEQMVKETVAAPAPPPEVPASRSLVESTAKRFIVKEQRAFHRAAKKYQGKPDELRAWAESFYKDHLPLVTDALTPTLQAAGISQSPGEVAKRHCSTALKIIGDAITGQLTADDVVDSLEDQAGNLADSVLKGL